MTDANSLRQLFKQNERQNRIPFSRLLDIFSQHFGIKELTHLTEVLRIITDSEEVFITEQVFGQLVYTYINSNNTLAQRAFFAADFEKKLYLTKFEFEGLCMNLRIGLTEAASKELWRSYSMSNRFNCQQWCQCYNNLMLLVHG